MEQLPQLVSAISVNTTEVLFFCGQKRRDTECTVDVRLPSKTALCLKSCLKPCNVVHQDQPFSRFLLKCAHNRDVGAVSAQGVSHDAETRIAGHGSQLQVGITFMLGRCHSEVLTLYASEAYSYAVKTFAVMFCTVIISES